MPFKKWDAPGRESVRNLPAGLRHVERGLRSVWRDHGVAVVDFLFGVHFHLRRLPLRWPGRSARTTGNAMTSACWCLGRPSFRRAVGERAERKVEAPITCKLHDPERVSLELEAHNSFTINGFGQLGSNGTLLAKQNALPLTRNPRRKSQNKKIYEVHPSFNKRCHLAHDCRLYFSGRSRRRRRSRSWGISRPRRTSRRTSRIT